MALQVLPTQLLQQKLDELQTTLSELDRVQKTKCEALASLDTERLLSAADVEGELSVRLREALVVEWEVDPRLGSRPMTLGAAVRQLPDNIRAGMEDRLAELTSRAEEIQSSVASHWLSIWRINEHVSEMVDILARAGQSAEVDVHHGLFFDSTA